MKKLLILFATVLMSISVHAESPQHANATNLLFPNKPHSMGVMFGSVDGVSYRFFIDEHWAIQTILMWKYLSTYGTTVSYYTADNVGTLHTSRTSQWGKLYGWTSEINPNFIYQTPIHIWDWGGLYWNSGAGISLGIAQDWEMDNNGLLWGKFGINSISGFELGFRKYPISIFTESFAGYGLLWNESEKHLYNVRTQISSTNHFIDWGSDIGIRYAF